MYYITSSSKNAFSVKQAYKFFNSLNSNKKLNLNIIKKCQKNLKKKQLLTILKSPHVNKTAQEQFELKTHLTQLILKPTTQNFKLVRALKKLLPKLFPDIKTILQITNNNKEKSRNFKKALNINDLKVIDKTKQKKILKKLNILDNFGEIAL